MRDGNKKRKCLALLLCLQMVMMSLGGAAETPDAGTMAEGLAAAVGTGTTGTDSGAAAEPAAYVLGEEEPSQWSRNSENREEEPAETTAPPNEKVGDGSDKSKIKADRVENNSDNPKINAEYVGELIQISLQNTFGAETEPENVPESTAGVKEGLDDAAEDNAEAEETSDPETVISAEEADGSTKSGPTVEAQDGSAQPGTAGKKEKTGDGASPEIEFEETAALSDGTDRIFVRCASEEVVYITFQYFSRGSVFPHCFLKVYGESLSAPVCATATQTSRVVIDEVLCEFFIQIIVAHGSLKHTVFDPCADNLALLRFVNEEDNITVYLIPAAEQPLSEFMYVYQTVTDISGNAVLPHDISAADEHCIVEGIETTN